MINIIKDNLETYADTKETRYLKAFINYSSKMSIVTEIVFSAMKADPDNLVYKGLEDEDWTTLLSHSDYEIPKKLKNFMAEYTLVCEFLCFGSAVFGREKWDSNNKLMSIFKTAKWAGYYALFKK